MKCKKPKVSRTAKVVKASTRQIGKSDHKRDKPRKALKPGKRLSRSGKTYYERRKNRSDKKGLTKKKVCKKK